MILMWISFGERALPTMIGLVLQTAVLVFLGMAAGRFVRRAGPAWQAVVYRATFVL